MEKKERQRKSERAGKRAVEGKYGLCGLTVVGYVKPSCMLCGSETRELECSVDEKVII